VARKFDWMEIDNSYYIPDEVRPDLLDMVLPGKEGVSSTLTPRERYTLYLFYDLGFSIADISKRLCCNRVSVQTVLKSARIKIRKWNGESPPNS
jgi:DNA-binding CsgD family transcriptional regulator